MDGYHQHLPSLSPVIRLRLRGSPHPPDARCMKPDARPGTDPKSCFLPLSSCVYQDDTSCATLQPRTIDGFAGMRSPAPQYHTDGQKSNTNSELNTGPSPIPHSKMGTHPLFPERCRCCSIEHAVQHLSTDGCGSADRRARCSATLTARHRTWRTSGHRPVPNRAGQVGLHMCVRASP